MNLQKSEARYRKLLEMSPDAILLGRGNAIQMANDAAVKLFQVSSASELIGRTLSDFVTGESRAAMEQVRRDLYSGEMRVPHREIQILCRGGAVDVEIAAASCRDDDGVTVHCVIRDVSERKRAEQALRDSEEQFRQLAENIHEVFFVVSPAGDQAVYVSPGYERLWGRSRDKLYRDPTAWQDPIHPDDLERVRALTGTRFWGEPVQFEYRIRMLDGAEKWIRTRSFPVRDPGRGS